MMQQNDMPAKTAPSDTRATVIALVVAVAFFMQMLDGTIIATSLPQMGASFGVPAIEMSSGITAYMLTMAAVIPISGWLGDKYGARRIFLLAILIFTVASVFCGFSQSLGQFMAARALQGIGGALMTPVGRVIVLKNAKKSELIGAIALITWPALTAPVIGPLLGGFITTYASWHWNFFVNIPFGIVGLVLVAVFIPDQRDDDPGALDGLGFLLSGAGLVALLSALEWLVQGPVTLGEILTAGVGCVLLALSAIHFGRVRQPLLNLASLRVLTFSVSIVTAGMVIRTAINATPFLLPLLFQIGFGYSAVGAGSYVLVYFLGNLGMKSVTTPALRMFGFRNVLGFNGVIVALSLVGFGFIGPQTPDVLIYALLFIAGLSRSMQFTAMNSLSFADIGPNERSSASTLSSIFQQIALMLGVAVGAAVLNMSADIRGMPNLDLEDFRMAFWFIGAITLLSALRFFFLPRDVAAEVSGYRAR